MPEWLTLALVGQVLTHLANIAAILTAVFAGWIWLLVVWKSTQRRREVEAYLKLERDFGAIGTKGSRTIHHLVANLAMSEEQITSAAFESKVIRVWSVVDDKKRTTDLLYQYEPDAVNIRAKERSQKQAWVDRERASNSTT
ncbi:hypothetical protein GGQ99_004775 [Aminobacter niigataensis]|uniref:Uncharacterized protein n=1 Tax=Aminobacter niigataensis TaxID=83265 RepID=A0ABR6L858_9HYPH|nr:hypothetical protein [Aminobacter niigataensis]MBB4652991.1 hypothetical protein [Aminobacter niigataensis]